MICDDCRQKPAIYGDGVTWGRCADCQKIHKEIMGIEEKKEPTGVTLQELPHQTIEGLTSIIIPIHMANYHLFHLTGNCLGSVREHTNKKDTPYEIIVVDNGSPVQPPALTSYYADKVIVNKENLGWVKAVNQGIRAAFGEYIVLLNNDTQVYDNWLFLLRDNLMSERFDLVMAHPMYSLTEPFARATEAGQVLAGQKKFDPIPGGKDFACVAFKKSLVDEIGSFDETFVNYCADIDFLKRMDQAGKEYGIEDLVAIHHISDATGYALGVAEQMNEDKAKFEAKWAGVEEVVKPVIEPCCGEEEEKVDALLIRTQETGDAIYLVVGEHTHHVRSPQVLETLGFRLGQEKTISKQEFGGYKPGEAITMDNVEKYKNA